MHGTGSIPSNRAAGFTLIELAVVIFIIALLLGSLFVPLQSQVESRKYDETQRIIDQARDALLGYAAAHGYLPCPADFALGSNGAEAAGSTHGAGAGACPASVTATTGGVNVYIGFLPAVTLGLTPTDANGYAVDSWGFRIRYAVSSSTVNGVNRPFTNTNGMRNALMTNIINSNTLLNVCMAVPVPASTTACSPATTVLASTAIAVVWSLGPNAQTSGGTSGVEAENAEGLAAADRIFIKRDLSKVVGSEFDDVITWISPPLLFNRLIAAGQLP